MGTHERQQRQQTFTKTLAERVGGINDEAEGGAEDKAALVLVGGDVEHGRFERRGRQRPTSVHRPRHRAVNETKKKKSKKSKNKQDNNRKKKGGVWLIFEISQPLLYAAGKGQKMLNVTV